MNGGKFYNNRLLDQMDLMMNPKSMYTIMLLECL